MTSSLTPIPTPPRQPIELTRFQRFLLVAFRPRKQWLYHPDSPGMKVLVVRTWVGRMLKPRAFATVYERFLTDTPTLWPPLLVVPERPVIAPGKR